MPTAPEYIALLLARHTVDLHQNELLAIAEDGYRRGASDLIARKRIVEAICRLAVSLSDQLADAVADDPQCRAEAARSRAIIADLAVKVGRLEAKLAEYETQSSSENTAVD